MFSAPILLFSTGTCCSDGSIFEDGILLEVEVNHILSIYQVLRASLFVLFDAASLAVIFAFLSQVISIYHECIYIQKVSQP